MAGENVSATLRAVDVDANDAKVLLRGEHQMTHRPRQKPAFTTKTLRAGRLSK
jgi:hypothetical protein